MAKTLTVYLAADLTRFDRGMRDAELTTQGFGSRLDNMLGPALLGAAAAAGALAVKLGVDGVKAAVEDQAAVEKLATTLDNLGLAHDTTAVEEHIDAMQRELGIADDKLRPAYDRLIRSVKSTSEANRLLSLSADIAAGTGKSLDSVVQALGRAYDGNTTSLGKLGAGIDTAVLKTGDMDLITRTLAQTFNGQAATAAGTYKGQLDRLKIGADELKEAFGYGLLSALDDADGQTQNLMDSMKDLEPVIQDIGRYVGDAATDVIYLTKKLVDLKNGLATLGGNVDESNGLVKSFTSTVEHFLNPLGYITDGIRELSGEATLLVKPLAGSTKQFEYLQYAAYNSVDAVDAAAQSADDAVAPLTDVAKAAFLAAGSFAALAQKQAQAEQAERDWAGTSGTVQSALLDLARKGTDMSNITTKWQDDWAALQDTMSRGPVGGGGAASNVSNLTDKAKALADQVKATNQALLQAAEEGLTTWQTSLTGALANLDAANTAIRDYATGIRDQLLDAFDIGKAFEAALTKDGSVSATKWIEGVDAQIAQIEWFGNVLSAIKTNGGPNAQALVDYLAAQGAETGGAMGQALINQGLVSTMANKLQTVTDAAATIGDAMVPEFMWAGQKSAAAAVESIASEVLAAGDKLKKIGKAIGEPIGKSLEKEIAQSVAAALTAAEEARTAAEARRTAAQATQAAAIPITDTAVGQALQRIISNSNARVGYQYTPGQTLVFG